MSAKKGAPRTSAGAALNTSGSAGPECCVCFKGVEFTSVGRCEHNVCHECSTRMRVLCGEHHCPICRHHLDKVYFMLKPRPFRDLESQPMKPTVRNQKYNIYFVDRAAKEAFYKLLEHRCKICEDRIESFENFDALRQHMKSDHSLLYCDVCVENLKVFTHERKTYDHSKLEIHRRKGDADDKSHKGHPLCEFCFTRYLDKDELLRHLRKEHLYCHLCDTDGFHHYYGNHEALRDHFRTDHFACEEGECSVDYLTGVFRTEIDLKAHKAAVHGKGLSKFAAKQARTLELEFTLTPRLRNGPINPVPMADGFQPPLAGPYVPQLDETPDMDSAKHFPSLGDAPGPTIAVGRPTSTIIKQSIGALARTEENFPSLAGNMASSSSTPTVKVNINHQPGPSNAIIRANNTGNPNVSIQVLNTGLNCMTISNSIGKKSSMSKKGVEKKSFDEEFPTLSKRDRVLLDNDYVSPLVNCNAVVKKTVPAPPSAPAPAPMATKQAIFQQKPPTSEAFPALAPVAGPPVTSQQPQWIKITKAKEKTKPNKVAAAPEIPPSQADLDSPSDFPTLLSNSKLKVEKKKNTTVVKPSENPTGNNNATNNGNKESKKKKNKIDNSIPLEVETKINKKSNKENMKSVAEVLKTKQVNDQMTNKDMQENNNNIIDNENIVNEAKTKNFNLQDNFPTLAPSKGIAGFRVSNKPAPPGFARPKPAQPPPPGFQNTVPPSNGLTFTTSFGQSYNIYPHNYIQPSNFHKRNEMLVSSIMNVLDGAESIHEFKHLSKQFRDGENSAEEYYDHCVESMGVKFDLIFPELLALLPEIAKQQELYKIYSSKTKPNLATCQTCGQILVQADLAEHVDAHKIGPSNFPELGPPKAASASRRK